MPEKHKSGSSAACVIELLDRNTIRSIEHAWTKHGIIYNKIEVMLSTGDERLKQRGARLTVGAEQAEEAQRLADEMIRRRTHLKSLPRTKATSDGSDISLNGGDIPLIDFSSVDGGDCGGVD